MKTWTPALVLAAAASFAVAQPTVTFSYLPEGCLSANDMSPDGRYIIGGLDTNGDAFADGAYLYDTVAGTVTNISNSVIATGMEIGVAISDDGTIAAGNIPDPAGIGTSAGAHWNATDGWDSIGYFADTLSCPSVSSGWEVSGDGSTVVGLAWHGCNAWAIKWTQGGGLVGLENLWNGSNRASVVNHDGSIIAGFAQGTQNRTPAYWDGTTGDGYLIDPTAVSIGEVHGMSDDGSVLLVEYWDAANPTKDGLTDAYTWTPGGGLELIGDGSIFGGWSGIPMDISPDTGTIVGFDILLGNRRAWIQYEGVGACQDLVTFVESNGGDVPDGQTLEVCQAITSDGTTIIGHGFGGRAWMITIDDGCPADMNGDGILDNGDIGAFVAAFLAGDLAADFNGEGFLDNGDIGAFIAAFIAGC